MTALLASVRSLEEAQLAHTGGADIIDLKEPQQGALGAVAPAVATAVTNWIDGRTPVSATVGDLCDPAAIADAVKSMASHDVDIIKVGLLERQQRARILEALRPLADAGVRLVAVLFADRAAASELAEVGDIADAGLFGAMIDTAGKQAAGLRGHQSMAVLGDFVHSCRRVGLRSGLAGSLRVEDIDALLALAPDYLGFRGALCADGKRGASLDAARLQLVRDAIPRAAATALNLQRAELIKQMV